MKRESRWRVSWASPAWAAANWRSTQVKNPGQRSQQHSRLNGSIYLFLKHSWHCLQVSLWNFCIWRSFWWPHISVHVVIGASALALRYARGLIFFSISSASNFRGGLPKESLRLDQSFQNNLMKTDFSCRAFWISMPLVTLWTQISLKYAAEAVIRVQILPISSKSLIKYWPPG